MTNVSAALVFADHTDCPLCGGDDQVQVLIVRRRALGAQASAEPVGSVITCPLLPRLPQLFPSTTPRVAGGGAA